MDTYQVRRENISLSNDINEYVGKTFSYMLGVQNFLCIVHVNGFEPAGEKYMSDTYVGKSLLIDKDGNLYGDMSPWACACEYFEKYELTRIR